MQDLTQQDSLGLRLSKISTKTVRRIAASQSWLWRGKGCWWKQANSLSTDWVSSPWMTDLQPFCPAFWTIFYYIFSLSNVKIEILLQALKFYFINLFQIVTKLYRSKIADFLPPVMLKNWFGLESHRFESNY